MDINDILKGPQRRTKTVRIDGLPDLILTELTASERWHVVDELPDTNEGNKQNMFIAEKLLCSLLGYSVKPTKEQIVKFSEQYGHDVIDLLWSSLMDFSAIDNNAVDNAKKP